MNGINGAKYRMRVAVCVLAFLFFEACSRPTPSHGALAAGSGELEIAAKSASVPVIADPRIQFEASNLLPTPEIAPESALVLSDLGGVLRAGPVSQVSGSGIFFVLGPLFEASRAQGGVDIFCIAAVSRRSATGARMEKRPIRKIALPAPAIAIACMVGRTAAIVSCADGSLLAFDEEGVELWRSMSSPVASLVALPEGRAALLPENGRLSIIDAAKGEELVAVATRYSARSLSYVAGILIAAGAESISAYSEADCRELWTRPLDSLIAQVSSSEARVVVVNGSGGATILGAADGAVIASADGVFSPNFRPIISSGEAILVDDAGRPFAVSLESGQSRALSKASDSTQFLTATEKDFFFLREGYLEIRGRSDDSKSLQFRLWRNDFPFDAISPIPLVASGALVLYIPNRGLLAFDRLETVSTPFSAIDPSPEIIARVAESLEKYGPRGSMPYSSYIAFGYLADGLPLNFGPERFVLLRVGGEKEEGLRKLSLKTDTPADAGRILLSVFSENGEELVSNVDELGVHPELTFRLSKGTIRYVATGRIGEGDESLESGEREREYRIFLKK